MSLLEKMWDDTLAGPRPENGLGKLRKKPAAVSSSNLGSANKSGGGVGRDEVAVKVTRSITIVKPPQISTNILDGSTPPASPAGTPPVSPFSASCDNNNYREGSLFKSCGNGREAFSLMRRKSLSDAYVKANKIGGGARINRGPPFNDV